MRFTPFIDNVMQRLLRKHCPREPVLQCERQINHFNNGCDNCCTNQTITDSRREDRHPAWPELTRQRARAVRGAQLCRTAGLESGMPGMRSQPSQPSDHRIPDWRQSYHFHTSGEHSTRVRRSRPALDSSSTVWLAFQGVIDNFDKLSTFSSSFVLSVYWERNIY